MNPEGGMADRFISEPIFPVAETMDVSAMATGEPGLPGRFTWRNKEYAVAEVVEKWRETGRDSYGGGERYARKHWFRIKTADGQGMKIYCERQARSKHQQKARWWLFSLSSPEEV